METLTVNGTNFQPTTIHATMYFDDLPSVAEIARAARDRLVAHERFASRIVEDAASRRLRFERVATVDIEGHHLVVTSAAASATTNTTTTSDETGILEYIEGRMGRTWADEMATGRPLWYIHVIAGSNGGAVVLELHHAIADGLSLMLLLQSLFTDKDGRPIPFESSKARTPAALSNASIIATAHTAFLAARAAVKILLGSALWPDSQTALKGASSSSNASIPMTSSKSPIPTSRIHVLPPISLAAIKAIKARLACSVNDVMASALAGAVRRFLVYRADRFVAEPVAAAALQIRSLVPYAFPRATIVQDGLLHNNWILVSVPLPVGPGSATDRLAATKRIIDTVKRSGEALVAKTLQSISYHLLGFNQTVQVSYDYFIKHTLIFTNVPGFLQPVYFCGKPITRVQPIVANALPQFSVVSFGDALYMNYVVDPTRVVEAHRIGQFYILELQIIADENGIHLPILL